MKTFKKLISGLINETAQSFGGSVFSGFSEPAPRSVLSNSGAHYAFKDPEQLSRLNVFIKSFLSGSYVDPKEPLKELLNRLTTIGLGSRYANNINLIVGSNQIPLSVFGEKFGVTPTTDLTKEPFDRGADYPDMIFTFNLVQTEAGFVFLNPKIQSQTCTDCPTQVGVEGKSEIAHNLNSLTNTNESFDYISESKKEPKDHARVVELYLSRSSDGSKRILDPIYSSLKSAKKRGKYSNEMAIKRFVYAVESASRSLINSGKQIKLNDSDKMRAAKRLLYNFEKHSKSEE